MIFEQNSFGDGQDLINPDTQVSEHGYVFAVNTRTRYGYAEPVPKPIKVAGVPVGTKQGITSVGTSFILFCNGKAYYKLYNSVEWTPVPNFQMSDSAERIWTCKVPASSLDYIRKLNPSTNVQDAIIRSYSGRSAGMPAGIVCQDGITQPFIITFDEDNNIFKARKLGDYAGWTQENPEYVPVGLFMMFLNQKLFIVSPDRTKVFQSATGQPLNFTVNITPTGDKGGDAVTTSFAFDYDPITCLQAVNVTDSFVYATKNTTRVMTLMYERTVFGEPLFSTAAKIDTGILTQDAIADISGDYAFINYEGLRNFNAVQQLKFEGRNSVFSKNVSKLFKGTRLEYGVAISHDNNVLFATNTNCGNVILVYDSLAGQWKGIDSFNIGQIIQAATVDLPGIVRLYVISDNDNVYELYNTAVSVSTPALLTRAFSASGANSSLGSSNSFANAGSPINMIKSAKVDLLFRAGVAAGTITCIEFVNGIQRKTLTQSIPAAQTVVNNAIVPELQKIVEPEGIPITFNFRDTPRGFKLSYMVSWDNDSALMKLLLVTTDYSKNVADSSQTKSIGSTQL